MSKSTLFSQDKIPAPKHLAHRTFDQVPSISPCSLLHRFHPQGHSVPGSSALSSSVPLKLLNPLPGIHPERFSSLWKSYSSLNWQRRYISPAKSLLSVTGFPSGFLFHTQIALSTSILQKLSLLFLHSFLFQLMMFFLWQGLYLAQTQPKERQCITCLTNTKHLINVCRMSEGEWVSK